MDSVRIIEIKESIFEDNNKEAEKLRKELKSERTFLLNVMSSPGSGKTTTILRTIDDLREKMRIAVLEADIDSAVDAERVADVGIEAVQLRTGGMCHLDAGMTRTGIEALDLKDLDLVILENVGNLVCPAEFDTGATSSAMILSVPEGDDKPLKYPLMFSICDAILVNKIDCLPYFDFNMEALRERVIRLNPDIKIFEVSAKTGEGFGEWITWLQERVDTWNNKN